MSREKALLRTKYALSLPLSLPLYLPLFLAFYLSRALSRSRKVAPRVPQSNLVTLISQPHTLRQFDKLSPPFEGWRFHFGSNLYTLHPAPGRAHLDSNLGSAHATADRQRRGGAVSRSESSCAAQPSAGGLNCIAFGKHSLWKAQVKLEVPYGRSTAAI